MGASKSRRKTGNAGSFRPGDERINRKGRTPLSLEQREFRRKLHDMEESILASVARLVRRGEPSVVNKLIEKLAGADKESIDLNVHEERHDLKKLSTEELRQLRRLTAKASAVGERDRDGGSNDG